MSAFMDTPWRVVKNRDGSVNVVFHPDEEGETYKVALVNGGNILAAHAISALPDLVLALKIAIAKYGKEGGPWNVPTSPGSWIAMAKDAIDKAEGKQS
jgi:hypothetical protein